MDIEQDKDNLLSCYLSGKYSLAGPHFRKMDIEKKKKAYDVIKYYRIGQGNMLTYRISEETDKKKTC